MKYILLIIGFLFSTFLFSQELNVGGHIGTYANDIHYGVVTLGAGIEYRPVKSIFSINTELNVIPYDKKLVFTAPVYLKVIIGNKFRVCPTIGVFIRTNANYGWSTGLNVEMWVNNKLMLFAKTDYMKDYWKSRSPNHFGGSYSYIKSGTSIWVSVGFKKKITNKK